MTSAVAGGLEFLASETDQIAASWLSEEPDTRTENATIGNRYV